MSKEELNKRKRKPLYKWSSDIKNKAEKRKVQELENKNRLY